MMHQNEEAKFLWQLTVAEYRDLHRSMMQDRRMEYGIKGLAQLLGCSRSKAYEIKASGVIDKAITQSGKIIIIDCERALQLLGMEDKNPSPTKPIIPMSSHRSGPRA